ncbi:MAG TPA: acetyltransferase [Desulfobulbus sp.]|nr:acetyltransferase [Desulfobulbus sp.]HHD64393.1 acetyltransferase [Desulfobulbaceae bacterium]
MASFDVFNGDADGICALQQLRLHDPRPDAGLVTGVKRDIRLLDRLKDAENSRITVLDISMAVNREPLLALLTRGNTIFYADHHFSDDIPVSPALKAHIDPAPQTCTSLIIDKLLDGKYRHWAVVGAFGDNLDETARTAAQSLRLGDAQLDALRETGILLNYNGYGASINDLFYPPDRLYQHVHQFADPLEFHANSSILLTLRKGYKDDMARAEAAKPIQQDSAGRVFQLPDASWARRVVGVFSNTLARREPDLAHALLTLNADGSLCVSVRAPLNRRYGADELCRRFPTGGGRAAAAGINILPAELKNDFLAAFSHQFFV